ncbi:glycosyl transferase family 1 [Planctomycetales bacterium]|nr:glycosyl transferase family 1 [Planctomycetales bacterium]
MYNLKELNRKGYPFTFLAAAGNAFDTFKKDVADWDGVEFIDVPSGGTKAAFQSIRNALKTKRYSLMHSQGLRIGAIACGANYFQKVPHVITLHDVIVPQNDIPGRFKCLKKKIIGHLTRRATVIVPVSQDCAENHLGQFPVWKKGLVRIQPILNGIDVEKVQCQSNIPQSYDCGSDNSPVTGGFFGRFMPQKGFEVLLDALLILDRKGYGERFRMLVTVDQHGYRDETLGTVAENPVLKKMIQFIEPVADIFPLWEQVDVLVMPSRWEACPLLPMEAMIAGVPVIGSDCLGLREVLAGTPNAAPPNGNSKALADAIIDFIEHKEQRKTEAQQFAPTAIKRFDVRNAAEQLREIYENICRCNNSPLRKQGL